MLLVEPVPLKSTAADFSCIVVLKRVAPERKWSKWSQTCFCDDGKSKLFFAVLLACKEGESILGTVPCKMFGQSQGGSVARLKLSACTRRMPFDPVIVRVRVSLVDISPVEAGAQYTCNQQSALQAAHLNPAVAVAVRAAAVVARSASPVLCGSPGLSACTTRRLRRLRFGLLPPCVIFVVVVPRLLAGPTLPGAGAEVVIANTVGRGG